MVVIFVAGAITVAVDKSKPRGNETTVTAASIYKAMEKWSSAGVVVDYGVQQVQQKNSSGDTTGVADLMSCHQDSVIIDVLFFRTSFDENHYLSGFSSGMQWTGTSAKTYSNPVLVSVGPGFVTFFGWPKKGQTTTEGQVVDWMTATFGTQPTSSGWPVQKWNGVLSAVRYKSIGALRPSA